MEMIIEREIEKEFLESIVREVVKEFPLKIEEYQNGKTGIVNMFMGEIKSRSGDKFEPRVANELLMLKLQQMLIVNG
ncbi:MAG TPA: hypothetical protein VL728_05770 [Cyclobacteriaceae bacterium]|jgi:aspartyl-tRNA(Asn)/glutamyl-tRNA(Gln) amidotransferase subunit B|nr:hypothetical protein [Cyclobacteriaceae bacterium]